MTLGKCRVCGKRLTLIQVITAASRGHKALYCSRKCRDVARTRRYRAKAKGRNKK